MRAPPPLKLLPYVRLYGLRNFALGVLVQLPSDGAWGVEFLIGPVRFGIERGRYLMDF